MLRSGLKTQMDVLKGIFREMLRLHPERRHLGLCKEALAGGMKGESRPSN